MNQDAGDQTRQALYEKITDIIHFIEERLHLFKQFYNENVSLDNLFSYLLLKSLHLYEIEKLLKQEGLSSLHHITPHVLFSLKKIQINLSPTNQPFSDEQGVIIPKNLLKYRTDCLFGKSSISTMVTLDKKMIRTPKIFKELLKYGMNIARINCAHNEPTDWMKLVELIRLAEADLREDGFPLQQTCKIYTDLAGPKIRINRIISFKDIHSNVDIKRIKNTKNGLQWSKITVQKGDCIRIFKTNQLMNQSNNIDFGMVISNPNAMLNIKKFDRIFIDDGNISGVIYRVTENYLDWKVTSTIKKNVIIKNGKGVNFPDSSVHYYLPTLTESDMNHLPFICKISDIIGISFVHHPQDIKILIEHINKLTTKKLGIIAKIETKEAVNQLANIIYEGIFYQPFGIMIARGDLAVEVGYESLPTVQEYILNICEAAHLPVVWATGVLENLTKNGIPSRSEMSDIGIGMRTQCIMLNKGSFVLDSLKMLNMICPNK